MPTQSEAAGVWGQAGAAVQAAARRASQRASPPGCRTLECA